MRRVCILIWDKCYRWLGGRGLGMGRGPVRLWCGLQWWGGGGKVSKLHIAGSTVY